MIFDGVFPKKYIRRPFAMKIEIVLAKNVRQFRKKRGLSQEEMAELCSLSPRGYRMIENCEVSTKLENVNKLSKGTGLTGAQLLTENLIVE